MNWRQAHHSLLVSFHLSSLRSVRGVLFDFYGPAGHMYPLPATLVRAPLLTCALYATLNRCEQRTRFCSSVRVRSIAASLLHPSHEHSDSASR